MLRNAGGDQYGVVLGVFGGVFAWFLGRGGVLGWF